MLAWMAGSLLFALLTLGVVDGKSARDARARVALQPQRPLLLVDLEANRAARGGAPVAEFEGFMEAAERLGRPLELFEGKSLDEIDPDAFSAWILPAQERLSDADWVALDEYLSRDGGLVLTGATGRRSRGGFERERSVLERVFPAARFERRRTDAARLRVVGRSPLVAGFAPGAELAFDGRGRALVATSPGALEFRDAAGGSPTLFGRHRSARVAWLGFSIWQLADASAAQRVAGNALRYAAREPLLDLRPWPDGRPCAVLVNGEGSAPSPHDPCRVRADVLDEPDVEQLFRHGCRSATTGANLRALPQVFERSEQRMVAIPEPRPRRDAHGAALLRDLLASYERAERMGSVFSLRSTEGWRAAKGREALMESVSAELGARGAWFARPEELAEWWLAREQVEARIEPIARDAVRVVFANRGEATARGVTARVYVPAGAFEPRAVSDRLLVGSALLRLATDHSWVELVAAPLDPGAEVSYTLRF